MNHLEGIVKYVDLFGTKFTFYSDKMQKYYTVTGGFFSLISIFVCILIFTALSLDDLKRKNPITTTSSVYSGGYRKIKFGEEKIWIPWRIVDFNNNKLVNHTGLLFPIIYYKSGIKDNITNKFIITTKILNYKLCSETSMAYKNNIDLIPVPLNELYCIDMDDLEMGGSKLTHFFNYISFGLYFCEDGINYDEINPKCSSYQKLNNLIGPNNSLEIALYYPVVQFQPYNKTNPIIVLYRQNFYQISKYTNKIEKLSLQENILTDDIGWIIKNEISNSYWGLKSLRGDSYYTLNEKDLINEGSNSRAYTFNIYIEPEIVHYKRYYKKIYNIFNDFFPIAYLTYIIIKNIAKVFKKVESNKKMMELLFENLKEKQNLFEEKLQKLRLSKNIAKNITDKIGRMSLNRLNIKKNEKKPSARNKYSVDLHNSSINNTLVRYSSSSMIKRVIQLNNNEKQSLNSQRKNSRFAPQNKKTNINININTSNQNLLLKENIFKNNINPLKINESNQSITPKKKFIKQQLFPYKYYLCSIFIRNLDTTNKVYFVSSRFTRVYTFLCQLFDITTYLCLLREFNALKTIFNEKSLNIIERKEKININANSFIKDINDCIGEHKLHILAQGIKNNEKKI